MERRADFIGRMAQYSPEELGFLDKMSCNARSIGRCYGRSQKNTQAKRKQLFVHGHHTSTTSLLTIEGIAATTVVEGYEVSGVS